MRQLPPFAAIRAFEAAARHLSFNQSAEELCVTPSAISHQIGKLEKYLATDLFIRKNNRLELTLTGKNYVGRLTTLFDNLERSTRDVLAADQNELRILSTPGFAARWLVPRLHKMSFCNDIRLRISDGAPSVDFSSNNADIVIHWANSAVSGVIIEPFMSSVRYPVISAVLKEREKISSPNDLLRLTLFRDEVMDGWAEWFKVAGVEAPTNLIQGPQFPHCELSTTAAEQGQGVALAYDAIIRDTLKSGRLVRLFNMATLPNIIYSVAYKQDRANEQKIKMFRDWIFCEINAEKALPHTSLTVVG